MFYDPRSISSKVYHNLQNLKDQTPTATDQQEQKSQSVELYNYVATWGLFRLKAEQKALNQEQKKKVVKCFFETLEQIAFPDNNNQQLSSNSGLNYLSSPTMNTSKYLGLTGLALQVAREFAFWAEAIYPKEKKKKK
ncbi:hypothetical protein [Geminocystis sp. GBBB08]|uniref:hypothetical protein n=1 Tax=Geminocystis sp. GBBB08 TaxID=2604140 RepID=UPI0027E2EF63|nr:hypothetical protein [Geminocystis sp. GBBB08]MBL1208380.1 hypothetical protein [Geminocystis sp. GBBB08]